MGVSRTGGAEGPGGSVANWGIFCGGGTKYFLFGPEMSTKTIIAGKESQTMLQTPLSKELTIGNKIVTVHKLLWGN